MNEYCIVLHRIISTLPNIWITVTQIKTYLQTHTVYPQIIFIIYSHIKRFMKVHTQKIKLYLDLIKNLKTTMFLNSPKTDISVCSVCSLLLITLCPSKEREFLDCSKIQIHVRFHQHNPDLSVDFFRLQLVEEIT